MEPNLAISGDEARLLMQAITNKGMQYNGSAIPVVTSLLLRLQDISINQPPQLPDATQIGDQNDSQNGN